MLKRRSTLALALFGVLVAGSSHGQLAPSAWPTFHRDGGRGGQAAVAGPHAANLAWTYRARGAFRNSPAIGVDGTIYIGVSRLLCALNPVDGSEKWCVNVGNPIRFSSPTVGADGTIYIGARNNKLMAFDPNGVKKWDYAVGIDGDVSTSAAIAPDGSIYFGGVTRLHRLNPDGTLGWVRGLDGFIFTASPALAPDGTIYTATVRGSLYAFDPDGTLRWQLKVGRNIKYATPVVGPDGTVYIGTRQGLVAVSSNGTLAWELPVEGRGIISTPAIGPDGTIYVGSKGGGASRGARFFAISPAGQELWSVETDQFFRGAPAIGADGVVYATSGPTLMAFTPTGSVLWSYTTKRSILASPALGADGTLYIGSNDRTLYALAR